MVLTSVCIYGNYIYSFLGGVMELQEGAKGVRMEIRIEKSLKEEFERVCNEKAYNKSEILRRRWNHL